MHQANPTYPKNVSEIPCLFFNAMKALTFSDNYTPKFLSDINQKATIKSPLGYCTSSSNQPSGTFIEILEECEVDYLD